MMIMTFYCGKHTTNNFHFYCFSIMEAKLTHDVLPSIPLKPRVLLRSSSPLPTYPLTRRFPLESLGEKKIFFIKRFQDLSERWEFHVVQEQFKVQNSNKQFLVHVVKEGETLTSISRRYNISIQEIGAVNDTIVDVDFVLEGQCLKIPYIGDNVVDTQINSTLKSWSYLIDAHKRRQSSFSISEGHENHRNFSVLSPHHLLFAKRTGYFLLLVPIMVICVRCIINAFHHRISKNVKNLGVNKSEKRNIGSGSVRWKSALRDIREPEISDTRSNHEFENPSYDESEVPFDDIAHDYSKLEPAYQKFLSECGISECGYWRGGSPD